MRIRLFFLSLFLFSASWTLYAGDRPGSARKPGIDESPFGVLAFFAWNHDWNFFHYPAEKVKKAASLMREAGIGWVRMDFLWSDIEPEKGRFSFKKYDEIVNILTASNIRVLGILEYNPDWRGVKWNSAPDPELYVRYACRVADHFKGRVKHWEIWNEPDERTYWEPQDNLKAYSALLKTVYTNLKKTDPECVVATGGFSATIVLSLRRLYKAVGKEYFDIVNIHPFVNPLLPDRVNILKSIHKGVMRTMREFQDGHKPVWFTETGCPGVKEPDKANGWWHGMSPTEEQQAEWVGTVYRESLKLENVQKVFWAFFRETPGHFKNGVDHFGLVDIDFLKKPSFNAYRQAVLGKE